MSSSRRKRRAAKAQRVRRALVGLAALILLAGAVLGWRMATAPDPAAHFADAEAARKREDFDSAIIHYKNVLVDAPDHLEARWRLGQVYLRIKDTPAALATLEAAQSIGTAHAEFWLDLAHAELDAGHHEEALRTLSRYQGPDRTAADALAARARVGLGETGAARTLLQSATARDPAAASLQLATARLALSEKDLDGAEAAVRKALTATPTDPDALLLLGRIQMLKGQPAEAGESYREASEQRSGVVEGLIGMAEAQLTEGRLDAAEETITRIGSKARGTVGYEYLRGWLTYQRQQWSAAEELLGTVVSAAPRHPQALLMLADACYQQARYNQAETHLKAFNAAYPDQPAALKLLATVYLKQRRSADALQALAPLATRDDLDAGTLALLSFANYSEGQVEAGREYLERAQALAPESPMLRTQAALGTIASGDAEGGIAELERLADEEGQASPRQALTFVHLMKGDVDAAAESARALVDMAPSSPQAHNLLGIALAKQGDRAAARTAIEKALSLDGKFAPALANLGLLALADKQVEAGEKYLRDALAASPGHTVASLALASLLAERKDDVEADRVLEAAIAATPDAASPRWQLAARRLRAGDTEGALALARAAHARSDGAPEADLTWGVFLARAGQPQEALAVLEKLHADAPDSVRIAVALAEAGRVAGRPEVTQRALRAALRAQPDDARLRWRLFQAELQMKAFDAARELLSRLEKSADAPTLAAQARAELAAAQGQHADAVVMFEALHAKSLTTATVLRLVEAQRQAGQMEEALRTLDAWLAEHPDDLQANLSRGSLALASADEETAVTHFERALAHAPGNAVALNNLAWLYDQREDARALDYAQRAYAALPDSAETADTLGWILARQATADRALPLLEKARTLLPEEPNIRYHQAYAWAKAGRQEQAREALEALLKDTPAFDAEPEARALLRRLSSKGDDGTDAQGLRF